MTTRTAAAAVAGATVLAIGGVVAALPSLVSNGSTTQTLQTVECQAITSSGTVANACAQELLKWQQEFRNGLGTNTYYPKWRSANPGEYGRLRTWGTSAQTTPQPMVATGYGGVVRYGLGQCRTWAVDLTACLLP